MSEVSVRSFTGRNEWLSLAAIARDWAAIVGLTALGLRVDRWAFYVVAVWIIGMFQFALSEALLHEAAHYNLFRSRRLHHRLEVLYGLPFFLTVAQYQSEHRIHHARLGGEGDGLVRDYRRLGLYDDRLNVAWIWLVKPVLGFGCYYASTLTLRPFKEGAKIVGFWVAVLAAFYAFGLLHVLVWYWFVPLVWSNYAFVYWSEIENHFNTRSGTRTNVSPLYNLLVHNGGYHAIHHRYPTIPWFNLPKAHALLGEDGEDVSSGFLDTYRQLRQALAQGRIPVFLPRANAGAAPEAGGTAAAGAP